MKKFGPALVALAAVSLAAALGGFATDVESEWYRSLDKPSFQPPGWVFGAAWTVLYLLIAFSAWRAWQTAPASQRNSIAMLFAANLILNVAWTWIFFAAHAPVAAGVEIVVLLASTVGLIVRLWRFDRAAAWALVPYALWIAFATALTWTIAVRS